MAETTGIAWTDATWNPWWGCMKVGPGCDHCYAEVLDHRVGGDHWGAGKPRRYFGEKHWNEPLRWNRKAAETGERKLVFCASMADVFDNEVEQEHRERLWALIRATPALTWQIVTKRIGNAVKMLPADWGDGYANVWLIETVVNQDEADRDIPKLLATPARVRGLSVEPQLGPIDAAWALSRNRLDIGAGFLRRGVFSPGMETLRPLDWIICGGESGSQAEARPFHIEWAESIRDQCVTAGAAFFMKQTGSNPVGFPGITGKGDQPHEWPVDLRVREFPHV